MNLKKEALLLILILLAHSVLVVMSMNQPFQGDEAVFSESAKAILKTGRPVFDYGQTMHNFENLKHPPLYNYIISLFILVFGESIYVLRSVSAIFNFLTVILVYLSARELLKNNKNCAGWGLFAAALYALNPLTIQSSVVMDIDGGILNFFSYLFLYFYIKNKSSILLIGALSLVFFSKMSGAVMLFLSMAVFTLATEFKKALKIIWLFLAATVIFLAVFWVYTYSLNLDFLSPFVHNFSAGVGEGMLSLTSILRMAWAFKSFIDFSIPFLVALFIVVSIKFYKDISERGFWDSEEKKAWLYGIFAMVSILVFTCIRANGYGFPKYFITALPAMSIFISYSLSKKFFLENKKKEYILICVILAFYFLVYVGDPLIPKFDSTAENTAIIPAGILILKSFFIWTIIPFAATLLIFRIFKVRGGIILTLLFLTFFCYGYISLLQASANYSTYYRYGDTGMLESVQYIKDNHISPKEVVTYLNIGDYIGVSDYYEITYAFPNRSFFKQQIVENDNLKYLLTNERDIARIGSENMNYFALEKKIGSYYLWKKGILNYTQ